MTREEYEENNLREVQGYPPKEKEMESINIIDIASNDFIKKKIRSLPLLHELEVVNSNYDYGIKTPREPGGSYRATIIQRIDGGLLYHSIFGDKFTTTFVAREHNR